MGDNLARTAFLDEAGISRPDEEPWVVMAGVIIHNDSDWKKLEDHLWRMITDNFPKNEWNKAFFHAHLLYNGRSPFDAKHGWPEEKRFRVLEELASLPLRFDLPIIYGHKERAELRDKPPNDWVKNKTHQAQVICSMVCIQLVEKYMRNGPAKNEIAQIVMEDTRDVRRYIKEVCRSMRNPPKGLLEYFSNMLPLERVVGSPHFEEKEDVSLLQIADVCAYVIKRRLMHDKKIDRFFDPMRKMFLFANDKDPTHPLFKPWDSASR